MGIESNRALLSKADLALSDLASGGILRPAQADQFIRLAIRESTFIQQVTVKPMASYQEDMDKTRFAGRVLQPGVEATALPLAMRSRPTMSTVQLNAQLFKAEVRMSNEVLEDQIERSSFNNTIMQMLSKAIARDMETVVINGSTISGNALLAVLNGVLVQTTANQVNAGTVRLNKTHLRDVIKALDDEFSNDPTLRFWTNRQARIDYRDSLSDRATALGDAALLQSGNTQYADIPVIAVPEFPPTTETGGSVTQVLHTAPANVVVGIWRKIRVQLQEDASAGVVIIVASLRFDTKLVEVNASSKVINVVGT